jgi:hypothetical protein
VHILDSASGTPVEARDPGTSPIAVGRCPYPARPATSHPCLTQSWRRRTASAMPHGRFGDFDGEEFRRVAVHAEPSFAACSHRHCEQDPTSIRRSDEGLSNMLHDGELRCVAERLSNQQLHRPIERCRAMRVALLRSRALVPRLRNSFHGRTGATVWSHWCEHVRPC